MLGSGALVVLAEGTDLLAAATNVLRFFRNESCGKCVPCRVGSTQGARDPARRASTPAAELDDDRRAHSCELEETMRLTSICGLGPGRARARDERARAEQGGAAARDAAPPGRCRGPAGPVTREFFTVRTVGEALAGFRPARRTAVEAVALAEALAPACRPRRARAGRRCRASPARRSTATRCAPPTPTAPPRACPRYLDLAGAVRMGAAPDGRRSHGTCDGDPDRRGCCRDGADAVVMVEHTAETDARHDRGDRGRSRRATGWSAPTRTPPPATCWCPAGPAAARRRTSGCWPRPA